MDRKVIKTLGDYAPKQRTQWKAGASASIIKQQLLKILTSSSEYRQKNITRTRAYSQEERVPSILLDERSH